LLTAICCARMPAIPTVTTPLRSVNVALPLLPLAALVPAAKANMLCAQQTASPNCVVARLHHQRVFLSPLITTVRRLNRQDCLLRSDNGPRNQINRT